MSEPAPESPDWANGWPDWPEPDFAKTSFLDPKDYPTCDYELQPLGSREDSPYGDVYIAFGRGIPEMVWGWYVTTYLCLSTLTSAAGRTRARSCMP